MSKKMIIIATTLLLVGAIAFVFVMTLNSWDFKKLSTVDYETNTYTVDSDFSSIVIDGNTEDVKFALSDDGVCKVVCFEEATRAHDVTVENGVLKISQGNKKWYEHIEFSFYSQTTTVYLPKTQYEALSVDISTGDIEIGGGFSFSNASISTTTGDIEISSSSFTSLDASATTGDIEISSVFCTGDIKIKTSTGSVKASNTSCSSLTRNGTTGDTELNNVVASGKLSVEQTTGDIKFNSCDAAEVYMKATTGDIKGSFKTGKTVHASSTTGDVNVPSYSTGGDCTVKLTTGDIDITIE